MADTDLKRYVRQKQLGAGGMGEVWLAEDTLLNRLVAIKQLKATDASTHKEFFISEAQMLASLNHPNITLIYDAVFDEEHKRYYLIMEYVQGKSLEDLIDTWTGPLPLDIVLDITIDVLRALQYAHDQGIVHRDIKPANVIIQDNGAKLTDFGVAGLMKILAEGSDYIVGTPTYISPEQIEGEPTDGRADLYSLGIMLYQMTSGGHQPFDCSDTQALFEAHLEEEPYPLTNFAPDLPLAFERAIMRLLAKKPAGRYPSANALLNVLQAIKARQKFSQPYLQLLDPEAKPLVGRTDELNQMEAVWSQSYQSAKPHLLIVRGDAGLGKTRLVAEFLGQHVVDKGFVAVAGRCDEAGVPYAPFAEILATIFNKNLTKSKPAKSQVDQLLSHIPSLGRLLDIPDTPKSKDKSKNTTQKATTSAGGLWAALGSRVPESSSDSTSTEWQFFATVLSVLTELGPTVLFLENANFLDDASVALTRFLIGQAQSPLVILAAYRSDGKALPWVDSFSADDKVVITLSPLPLPAVKDCVSNLVGSPIAGNIVDGINERAQGNPLQLEEITRQLLDSNQLHQDENGEWSYTPAQDLEISGDSFLPKAVVSAFSRRIDKLSQPARQALAIAALIEPGAEFDVDLWMMLLRDEVQPEAAQQILDEALKQRLIRQIGDRRYAFRPVDVAKGLAATLPESRQRELHSQMAEILHNNQADPVLVGHHYDQAGLTAQATRYLETAGAKALAANATSAAFVYYNRAVTLVESESAYKALGQLYRQKGERKDSIHAFERALDFAKEANNIMAQAQILNDLAYTYCLFDRYKKAYQSATAVLKLVGVPRTERATAQSHLGKISWLVGQLEEAENWCQKALVTLMGHATGAILADVYSNLGQIYASQGKLDEADTAFQHSLGLYQKLDDDLGQGHNLKNLGRLDTDRGHFDEAASLFNAAYQRFEKIASREGFMAVFVNRGRNLLYQGYPEEALPLLTKALHLALEKGKPNAYILSDIYLLIAQAYLDTGNLDRAKFVTNDALKLVEAAGNQVPIAQGRAMLAQIFAVEGDQADAEANFKKALALLKQTGSRPTLLRVQLRYAQFLAQNGQTAPAATLEQETRDQAAAMGLSLYKAE